MTSSAQTSSRGERRADYGSLERIEQSITQIRDWNKAQDQGLDDLQNLVKDNKAEITRFNQKLDAHSRESQTKLAQVEEKLDPIHSVSVKVMNFFEILGRLGTWTYLLFKWIAAAAVATGVILSILKALGE